MRIYCVPCPYLTSPSVPQWSELRRGEPATESVERIHPSLLFKTSEQRTDQLIIVPEMKQFLPIRRRCLLLSHFHHRYYFIFIPVCPSSVCRAPLHRPHATICLFSFFSRLWLQFTSAPELLTLLPSLFHLAAPSVPSVRLRPAPSAPLRLP